MRAELLPSELKFLPYFVSTLFALPFFGFSVRDEQRDDGEKKGGDSEKRRDWRRRSSARSLVCAYMRCRRLMSIAFARWRRASSRQVGRARADRLPYKATSDGGGKQGGAQSTDARRALPAKQTRSCLFFSSPRTLLEDEATRACRQKRSLACLGRSSAAASRSSAQAENKRRAKQKGGCFAVCANNRLAGQKMIERRVYFCKSKSKQMRSINAEERRSAQMLFRSSPSCFRPSPIARRRQRSSFR